MPLKLLHHKSFHVYNAENIARVARDEAQAQAEEDERERRGSVADSEARVERMRAQTRLMGRNEGGVGVGGGRKRGRDRDVDEAEKRLETQLKEKAKGKEREDSKGNGGSGLTSRGDGKAHLNFWAEFEAGAKATSFEKPERKLEKAIEQQKIDELTKVYLAKKGEGDIKGWYAREDGKTEKERKESDEMRLERAYKDGENKRLTDPLALMQSYLRRRDLILDSSTASSSLSSSSSARFRTPATPDTERGDLSPIITTLLAHQLNLPFLDASPLSTLDPRIEATQRVSSERARAMAVIAARKKELQGSDIGSVASTPARSEFGAQGYGMFNREETRDARGRWGEGRKVSTVGRGGGGGWGNRRGGGRRGRRGNVGGRGDDGNDEFPL
ncbi:BQ2448_2488 [Microbotryum intermedium]|uniref:BQ2448_2488 protein n=1 Tax=Microbotryum intermedium TaxID=269621 RepID=A0A238FEA4_9BASI|nr:BQ2448_2488 [Microbotryum intermedium]